MKKQIFNLLGWIFLITTPFALFCSENGNGWFLCLIYLSLGIMCVWIGNGGTDTKIRVKPKEMWEYVYRERIMYHFSKDTTGDENARKIADKVTRDNNCPMPTEEEKENIARSFGIVTKKMLQDEYFRINKLQFGKYYLMKMTAKYYQDNPQIIYFNENCKTIHNSTISPLFANHILQCAGLIEYVPCGTISFVSVFDLERHFGTSDVEKIWNDILSEQDKKEAKMWVMECIKRLWEEEKDGNENKIVKWDCEYKIKYGFRLKGRYDK